MNSEETSPNSPVCHPQSAALATDDVFVLSPVTIDGVSIAAGVLCLVTPGGETVRVPVDREKVGAVARALMTHPAVLLLAREGVALPKALPVPGNPLPVDTALPSTVGYANRLRALIDDAHRRARPIAHSALRALADDLSRAPDPCAGYPTAEAVLRTCDEVIAAFSRNNANVSAEACRCLRDQLAEVMAARPAQAPAKTYADGVTDAGTAVARVALTYCVGTRGRIAADECQDAIAALRASTPTAPAVAFDPALHVTRAEMARLLEKLAVGHDFDAKHYCDSDGVANAYASAAKTTRDLAAYLTSEVRA